MIAHIQESDSHYVRFIELLRQLHALIAHGDCDSSEADELRDEMDIQVPHLSPAQIKRVEGLSADFYSLTGDEICAPEDQANPLSEAELTSAWEARDWDQVLGLLRRPAPFLDASQIAMMRGLCWRQLDDLETVLAFYRRACELDPANDEYSTLLIFTLLELNQFGEARGRAEEIIDRKPTATPRALLKSAFALSASVDALPVSEQRRILLLATTTIDRAFDLSASLPPNSRISESELFHYRLIESDCYARLAQMQLPDPGTCTTTVGDSATAPNIPESAKLRDGISEALSAIPQRDDFYRAVIHSRAAEAFPFGALVGHTEAR